MSNVTRLRHALPMSPDINKAVDDLDGAIDKALDYSLKRWIALTVLCPSITVEFFS